MAPVVVLQVVRLWVAGVLAIPIGAANGGCLGTDLDWRPPCESNRGRSVAVIGRSRRRRPTDIRFPAEGSDRLSSLLQLHPERSRLTWQLSSTWRWPPLLMLHDTTLIFLVHKYIATSGDEIYPRRVCPDSVCFAAPGHRSVLLDGFGHRWIVGRLDPGGLPRARTAPPPTVREPARPAHDERHGLGERLTRET